MLFGDGGADAYLSSDSSKRCRPASLVLICSDEVVQLFLDMNRLN